MRLTEKYPPKQTNIQIHREMDTGGEIKFQKGLDPLCFS